MKILYLLEICFSLSMYGINSYAFGYNTELIAQSINLPNIHYLPQPNFVAKAMFPFYALQNNRPDSEV